MLPERRIAALVWVTCLFLSSATMAEPVGASGPEDSPEAAQANGSSLTAFAKIPSNSSDVLITAEGVKVNIKHVSGIDSIGVASNCPGHWSVEDNNIEQAVISGSGQGVTIRGGAPGGRAILNGHIYHLPQDADGVHNISISNNGVMINGQPLEPLRGSSVAGDCTGTEVLEVSVPETYTGGLTLNCSGVSVVQLDDWQVGPLIVNLGDKSTFTSGVLKQLAKTIIDIQGDGLAEISDLTTKALVTNITGSGSVTVKKGSADMSNATVSGTGSIVLRGTYKGLRKSVQGTGTIQLIN